VVAAALRRAFFLLLVLGAAGINSGCRRDTGGRVAVSGSVTFRGTPLSTGTIELVSKDGAQQSGATIADGKYSIPAAKGLRPGQYLVRISSFEEQGPAPEGPPGPESMKPTARNLLPPEYNTQSKLTAEVGEGRPLDFDLK
jgi:hypothetical protein